MLKSPLINIKPAAINPRIAKNSAQGLVALSDSIIEGVTLSWVWSSESAFVEAGSVADCTCSVMKNLL
jgi:hypothetical protein